MTGLLFEGPTLCAQPSIIRALNDHLLAIFVQQVHFLATTKYDGHRWAVLTNEEWCTECVLAPHQLKRVLARLVALGVVVRQQNSTYDRTAWTRVDYDRLRSMLKLPDRSVENRPDESGGNRPDPSGQIPPDVPLREKKDLGGDNTEKGASAFDAFWLAYPRKCGKPAAQRAWRKAARHQELLMVGLARWIIYWQARDEPEFVPHPSTWLNQERWNDDPPPVPKRSRGVMQDTADRIKVPLAESQSNIAKLMRKSLADVKGIGR